ncbi:MAG: alpha-glucosidase/alpha-galactosidase [SAR202 cluster bacterium]|jgi:alpha-galactosidase|nr:alpha-glucosidase/alpha-galactosidase [SAR202 cluster bacterium]MDP6513588.1 alpha-glucosidase/alpha-galactosidase [SAR202 cluster bacterium]
MAGGVKITLIGAGSAMFAAGIVRDLCVTEGLHGSHVTLMDVDEQRLNMTHRMATRLSDELDAGMSFSKTTDRVEALRGADFVINAAQVGGHDWTEYQRELAEKHGYYRGAKLHYFGQAAFFLDVARDIERTCPDAWLIQTANPVFEGCTLMTRATNVKVIGLCHGHYGYLEIAEVLGLDPKHVTAKMPGFNHWIWMTEFKYKGQDAYPLIKEWVRTKSFNYWDHDDRPFNANQMRAAAIHQYGLYGLMPIGDTPRLGGWWYHTDLETKLDWYGPTGGFDSEIGWGQYLERMSQRAEAVERAALDESKPISDTFEPTHSREQIVPIIDSIVNDNAATYQVNIPNKGPIIQGFPENLVVECEAVIDGSGVSGIEVPPLPPKLMAGAMIPRWREAEQMIEAIRLGDPDLLLLFLLEDHRTQNLDQAETLIREWLADPRNKSMADIFRD